MSFAQAAAELHVTPAALSFQIKSLEQHLGHPLFRRLNRAVELTEAGRVLQPGTAQGFAALTSAWRNAQRQSDTRRLTITAGPAFTAKWLAPRLFNFAQAHPKIELRFSATLQLADFDRDEVDIALRFGEGNDPGLYSEDMVYEWMTPMMSPQMAEGIKTPEDLCKATLLHQDVPPFFNGFSNWVAWFNAAGLVAPQDGGLHFSNADHAHDAAIAGTGVVLGRYSLAEKDMGNKQLVAPFPLALTLKARYRFLCAKTAVNRPQVAAFREWIQHQVSQMKTYDDDFEFIALEDHLP